jgi:hypothetical protein
MLPEISHRCASCGASIREPEMFCPECGKSLSGPAEESAPQVAAEKSAPAVESVAANENIGAVSQPATKVEPTPPTSDAAVSTKNLGAESLPISRTGTYEKARDSLHRASTATREALADNVKRVEKIRHVSSVMFEEATYDPSLRFVLVALALFVVFLVLLLLSKVMG